LALAGSLLLGALDSVYANQLKVNLTQDAERRADYLEQTFSRMLWNFALEELQAVGGAVIRDEVVLALTVHTDVGKTVFDQAKQGPALLTIQRTLTFEGTKVGDFRLVFSADTLGRQRQALTGAALGSFLGLLALLAVAAPFLLNRTVLRPFNRLSRALIGDPGSGPFPNLPEPSSQIREVRTFENALAALNRAVARQVDDLETRVEARTRELRDAQEMLVRTETLATLGQLAAGIAHELNTPLGAISSSIRYLQNELNEGMIPRMAQSLSLPENQDAKGLLLDVAKLAGDLENFPGTLSRRNFRNRWIALGGAPDTALFDLVTTTGLSSRLDELAVWSSQPSVEEAIREVAQWSRSLAIVALASEKGASVVSALRTQVQSGKATEVRPLELRREIDQALSLLQNKIKHGIRVELTSPGKVWVLGDPNELGKVWLNLMLNAVQAMDGNGVLSLSLGVEGGFAKFEVCDSGPGIADSVLPRIFEPFFTTKTTGMGLGLEISKRIVEAHHGTIEVESTPGRTVFRVLLPAEETGSA
jgi:signal transduction histidine kinase